MIGYMNYMNIPSTFNWSGLGDIGKGRSSLGYELPVVVYRLFQFALKDILYREYGEETSSELYRAAGHLAGMHFARNVLDLSGDFEYFTINLQKHLSDLKIGILNIEEANLPSLSLTLTMSENLESSGLPNTNMTVCDYDEGFLAGILEAYTGKSFNVKEVDCWATGDRTCRFTVDLQSTA